MFVVHVVGSNVVDLSFCAYRAPLSGHVASCYVAPALRNNRF